MPIAGRWCRRHERRSALQNTLARRPGLGALGRFLRYPRERERRGALRAMAGVGLERRAGEMAAGFGPLARARLGGPAASGADPSSWSSLNWTRHSLKRTPVSS
jgi:hypothetical protein